MTRDRNGIIIDDRGHVAGIDCHLGHGGNQGYVWTGVGEWYECQGCGNFRGAAGIREEQAAELTATEMASHG